MTTHDPRDLEWQRRYEQNDTPWDKGVPAPALVRFLQDHAISGRVLVPGCGRGHEVRALAQQPGCSAVGLDLSPIAVAEASELAARAGLGETASFIVGDFFQLPPEMNGSFDWLVEHTCFCAIDPLMRPSYAAAVAGALKPGGHLFAIFYLDPAQDRQPPFGVAVAELDGLFSPSFALVRQWVPARTFAGRESRELVRLLRRL